LGGDAKLLNVLGIEVEHAVKVSIRQRFNGLVAQAKLAVERTDQSVAGVVCRHVAVFYFIALLVHRPRGHAVEADLGLARIVTCVAGKADDGAHRSASTSITNIRVEVTLAHKAGNGHAILEYATGAVQPQHRRGDWFTRDKVC